jgi:Flp pilus assembly protein TadG
MKKRSHERGAVLVETALIVSTALTLMLFTVDIGILGFAQVSADAASFLDAHENVVGVGTGTPEQNVAGIFPIIQSNAMTTEVVPAPTPSVQVNYGYNSSNNAGSANQRLGGVSMMQPVQLQVTVSPPPFFTIAGQSVGVSSQQVEPQWTECGPHYNVANEDVACGSAGAPQFTTATYTQAENTPPYYVGYNLLTHCADSQPWGDTANGAPSATCQTANFLALGVSSYLYVNNWSRTTPGISGAPGVATFYASAFHQRVYSNIAQFFASYPTLPALYADYTNHIYNQLGVANFQARPPTTGGFSDFTSWTAFAASNTNDAAKADPNGIDEAIQCVYSWDQVITQGYAPQSYTYPGEYPLNPEKPCAANVTL